MMYTRTETPGIDANIDGLQRWLYTKLLATWDLTAQAEDPKAYNSYSRVYRNQTKDGYVAEAFVSGKDYKEVYLDDRCKVLSFFTLGETIPFSGNQFQADVGLIFFVDLTAITSGDDRQDELVRQQVVQLVQGNKMYGFQLNGLEIGVDSVLREYTGVRKTMGLKYRDMHPYHCFRLNFKVNYKTNC